MVEHRFNDAGNCIYCGINNSVVISDECTFLKMQAEVDQASKHLTSNIPPLLWNFYSALKEEGFSESEAFGLTKVYLATLGPNGVVL